MVVEGVKWSRTLFQGYSKTVIKENKMIMSLGTWLMERCMGTYKVNTLCEAYADFSYYLVMGKEPQEFYEMKFVLPTMI